MRPRSQLLTIVCGNFAKGGDIPEEGHAAIEKTHGYRLDL